MALFAVLAALPAVAQPSGSGSPAGSVLPAVDSAGARPPTPTENLPILVEIRGARLLVRQYDRIPYVSWQDLAMALGLEHYFSEITGSYSLIDGTPGQELAVEMTPESVDISINGEIRRLAASPTRVDGTLWLPVKPLAEVFGIAPRDLRFSRGLPPENTPPPEPAPALPVATAPVAPGPAQAPPSSEAVSASAAGTSPVGRTEGPPLPPMPRASRFERELFAGFRIVLFAAKAAAETRDDPTAQGAATRLEALLEASGFPVDRQPAAASWPAAPQVLAHRPSVALFLQVSARSHRFGVLYPVARTDPRIGVVGVFGPNSVEADLSGELAASVAAHLTRFTGVPGRASADPHLLPLAKLLSAGLMIDYPGESGPPSDAGEQAIARAIHDGILSTLVSRVRGAGAGLATSPAPGAAPQAAAGLSDPEPSESPPARLPGGDSVLVDEQVPGGGQPEPLDDLQREPLDGWPPEGGAPSFETELPPGPPGTLDLPGSENPPEPAGDFDLPGGTGGEDEGDMYTPLQ